MASEIYNSDRELYRLVQTPELVLASTIEKLSLNVFHDNPQSAQLVKGAILRRLAESCLEVTIVEDPTASDDVALWSDNYQKLQLHRSFYQTMQTFTDPDAYSDFDEESDGKTLVRSYFNSTT